MCVCVSVCDTVQMGFVIVSGGIADRLIVILVMQLIISSYRPKISPSALLSKSRICLHNLRQKPSNLYNRCFYPTGLHLLHPLRPTRIQPLSHVLPCSPPHLTSLYFALLCITCSRCFPVPPGSRVLCFLFANRSCGLESSERVEAFTSPSICMFAKDCKGIYATALRRNQAQVGT